LHFLQFRALDVHRHTGHEIAFPAISCLVSRPLKEAPLMRRFGGSRVTPLVVRASTGIGQS